LPHRIGRDGDQVSGRARRKELDPSEGIQGHTEHDQLHRLSQAVEARFLMAIYFIKSPDGPIKIGTTIRLSQRLKQLVDQE
jgi:hypothetical protein